VVDILQGIGGYLRQTWPGCCIGAEELQCSGSVWLVVFVSCLGLATHVLLLESTVADHGCSVLISGDSCDKERGSSSVDRQLTSWHHPRVGFNFQAGGVQCSASKVPCAAGQLRQWPCVASTVGEQGSRDTRDRCHPGCTSPRSAVLT
jgi:hypothetical protein